MTSMSQAFTSALFHFLWQGVAVALLFSVALFVLRRRPAESRYAAGCVALAVMALLPVVTVWSVYEPAARFEGAGPADSVTGFLAIVSDAAELGTPPAASVQAVRDWATPVWAFGVIVLSLRLLLGYGHVVRLRRRAVAAEDATNETAVRLAGRMGRVRPFRVMTSAIADGPSVVGWLRPVVLLPSAAVLGLAPQQLEAVLAHELAHIRRHDYLVNLLQSVLETLLFYHPAVWWISARVRGERELCCDDLAVEVSGDAVGYARALTALERLRLSRPQLALGAAQGGLGFRVRRLIGGESEAGRASLIPGLLAVAFGTMMVFVVRPGGMETPVLEAAIPQQESARLPAVHQATDAACSNCHPSGESSPATFAPAETTAHGTVAQTAENGVELQLNLEPTVERALQEFELGGVGVSRFRVKTPFGEQTQEVEQSEEDRLRVRSWIVPEEDRLRVRSWINPNVTWSAYDAFLSPSGEAASHFAATLQYLGLTAGQQADVDRVIESHRPAIQAAAGELITQESALGDLLEAEPLDRNAVYTQLDRVIRGRGELERRNTVMVLELREYLSRDQWIDLQVILQKRGGPFVRLSVAPDVLNGGQGGRGGRGGVQP